MGFSTGKWEGDTLAVYHHAFEGRLDPAQRHRRVATARRCTEHFIRHGENLTLMTVIRDPAYLTEPMIRTRDYVYEIGGQIAPVSVRKRGRGHPAQRQDSASSARHQSRSSPSLPAKHGIPPEAARGGADTMYPEYQYKIRAEAAAIAAKMASLDAK